MFFQSVSILVVADFLMCRCDLFMYVVEKRLILWKLYVLCNTLKYRAPFYYIILKKYLKGRELSILSKNGHCIRLLTLVAQESIQSETTSFDIEIICSVETRPVFCGICMSLWNSKSHSKTFKNVYYKMTEKCGVNENSHFISTQHN